MLPSYSHDDVAAMAEELEVLRDLAAGVCRFDDSLTVGDALYHAIDDLRPYVTDYREFIEFRAKRRAGKS